MSFFQKIMSFFGAAGAQVVSQAGEPLTADEQANLANSIEFNSLLQDEQQAIIAKQANDISTQNKTIAAQNAAIEANVKAIADLSAKFAALEATTVEAIATLGANVAAKVTTVAQDLNKIKGAPIVQTNGEQDPNNNLLNNPPASQVVTMAGYLAKLKKGGF